MVWTAAEVHEKGSHFFWGIFRAHYVWLLPFEGVFLSIGMMRHVFNKLKRHWNRTWFPASGWWLVSALTWDDGDTTSRDEFNVSSISILSLAHLKLVLLYSWRKKMLMLVHPAEGPPASCNMLQPLQVRSLLDASTEQPEEGEKKQTARGSLFARAMVVSQEVTYYKAL